MSEDALQRCRSIATQAQSLIAGVQAESSGHLPPEIGAGEHEMLKELSELIRGPTWQALEAAIERSQSLAETLQEICDIGTSIKIESQPDRSWNLSLGVGPKAGEWDHQTVVQSAADIEPWLSERSWPYREAFNNGLRQQGLNPDRYVPHDFRHDDTNPT